MDAVQEFSKENPDHDISQVCGYRRFKTRMDHLVDRGDRSQRVEAIAPMVIDVLNMPVNLDYQVKCLGRLQHPDPGLRKPGYSPGCAYGGWQRHHNHD